MKEVFLAAILLTTLPAFGQHGGAPPGYYPPGYSGDTWTGEVVSTDDTTREITLAYTNGTKSETFTAVSKGQLPSEDEGWVHEGTKAFGNSQGSSNHYLLPGKNKKSKRE